MSKEWGDMYAETVLLIILLLAFAEVLKYIKGYGIFC